MDDLDGRVAVIFGGGSGIGAATARAFSGAGIHVVVADIDADRAQAVVDELETIGAEGLAQRCDVTRAEDLEAARDTALERFGRVDIVMNNVSVIAAGAFTDIPWSEWERAIDVNLLAYVRSLQIFVPLLLECGDGHIVNTASTAGLYPYTADRLPYVATKSAIVGMSEALALDLVPRGVGVTCLCPGPVATNIFEQMRFYGDATKVRPPALSILEPEVVGEMVLAAVRDGTLPARDAPRGPRHPRAPRDRPGGLPRRADRRDAGMSWGSTGPDAKKPGPTVRGPGLPVAPTTPRSWPRGGRRSR